MKGNDMGSRTALLGEEFYKLSQKEVEILLLVHPYLDGLTHRQAAMILGITKCSVEGRLHNAFQKIPWLQEDMKRKRSELTARKESIRSPTRFGDMRGVSNDETHDTFFGKKIVEKF